MRCGAKQHFGGACLHGRRLVAQDMAQQDLRELVHEERRHVHALAAEQGDVAGLERRMREQPLAKAQPDRIVGARIFVGDGRKLLGVDCSARLFDQALVQGDFVGTRFGYRRQFRALQQAAQEIVGDHQVAFASPLQQAKAAPAPVVAHGVQERTSPSPELFTCIAHVIQHWGHILTRRASGHGHAHGKDRYQADHHEQRCEKADMKAIHKEGSVRMQILGIRSSDRYAKLLANVLCISSVMFPGLYLNRPAPPRCAGQ